MKKTTTLLCLLVFGAALIRVSFDLFSDGMFMDGLFYAAISNNLALGIGSFWDLSFTTSMHEQFHEHPPLAMGLQSLLFELFGESRFVERFYSLFTHIITGVIMIGIWNKISSKKLRTAGWVSLLFWMSIMLVAWAAAHNLLENTMMIFTSAAVYYMILGLKKRSIGNNIIAGLMIFLAFLTKGFVGLFVLSFFFWNWVFRYNYGFIRLVKDTAITLASAVFPLLILYLVYPLAIQSLNDYIQIQVVTSVNEATTVSTRFFILIRLLQELIPIGSLMIIVFVIAHIKKVKCILPNEQRTWVWMFIGLGLSGVIPIMISMKQSAYYMLCSFPILSIAFALIVAPYVHSWMMDWQDKSSIRVKIKAFAIGLIAIGCATSFMQKDRIGRDKEMLSDIYKIMELVPKGSEMSHTKPIDKNYSMHGYFQRYGQIGTHLLSEDKRNDFLLSDKDNETFTIPIDYEPVIITLSYFDLYQKVK